jgi:hypothetical protein
VEEIMKRFILVFAALACGTALAGEKLETAVKSPPAFESLDKNADKQISRTEAGMDRKLSNGFAFLDANGDGFLSPEEYAARAKS